MKAVGRLVPILLVLALALLPWVEPWTRTLLTIALAKGLAVLGVVVLLQAGQVSFGHAMFFALGAYAAAYVGRWIGAGGELVVLLLAGALVAGLVALAIGVFVVRYRYIFFAMLNLAFSMVLYSILEKFFHLTGGSDGLRIARPSVLGMVLERDPFEWVLFYLSLVLAVLVTLGVRRYLDSPLGHALKAIKSNETRLEYLGISARGTLLTAYVLSGVLCGLAGVLVGVTQGLATPEFAYWVRSGEFVFIAILGGAGEVAGAFVGSLVYEFVRTLAAAHMPDAWQAALGIILLVIILFAPSGIVGAWRALVRPRTSQPGTEP